MPIKIKNSKSWFRERLTRFKPFIFLKKNLPFFIFISLFSLSLIFGIWNIKRYEILDNNGEKLDSEIEALISQYLEKNVTQRNFFAVYSKDIEDNLQMSVSYVKSAKIGKVAPNKLEVFVDLYHPKAVLFDTDGHCKLLSATGIVLDELCKDTKDPALCCAEYTSDGSYYIFKSDEAEISKLDTDKEQLLVMKVISHIVDVVELFGFKPKEVELKEKVVLIKDVHKKAHIFTLSDNINTQLARYFVVMRKVKGDDMKFNSIDVRFERPVVKN